LFCFVFFCFVFFWLGLLGHAINDRVCDHCCCYSTDGAAAVIGLDSAMQLACDTCILMQLKLKVNAVTLDGGGGGGGDDDDDDDDDDDSCYSLSKLGVIFVLKITEFVDLQKLYHTFCISAMWQSYK
jgi:hypothetical protein